MQLPVVNIVWFKRDLRLQDHAPLQAAIEQKLPTILLFCFEPSIMQYHDSDTRHWRFIYESLQCMQLELQKHGQHLNIIYDEAIAAFQRIQQHYSIQAIFSHQEIGNNLTFNRDKQIKAFTKNQCIQWKEFATNGIIRGLKNRATFKTHWLEVMHSPIFNVQLSQLNTIQLSTALIG
jgi:deoxyribodipyrimidine photo-lyase